jgi:hypothetical protein
MTIKAEMKDTTTPTPHIGRSLIDKSSRFFHKSYAPAAMRVGTPRKKENSVAVLRDRPKSMPPMMVAPEREVPGIMATHWARPTLSASCQDIWRVLSRRGAGGRRSTSRMMMPPTMKASATGTGLKR